MERLYNETANTTNNNEQQETTTGALIAYKSQWGGMEHRYICSPGVASFFRAFPRGRTIYSDDKVAPRDTNEVAGASSKGALTEDITVIPPLNKT